LWWWLRAERQSRLIGLCERIVWLRAPTEYEQQCPGDDSRRAYIFTDMPYKVLVHRIANELFHPWVAGYRRMPFWGDWWHLVDVDPARRSAQA